MSEFKTKSAKHKARMASFIKKNLVRKESAVSKFVRQERFGVRVQMGPEVKNVDTNFLDVQPSSTGAVTLLNGMVQGTSTVTRIGQKIEMTSCQIKFGWYSNTISNTTTPGFDLVQMSLVYDKQSNGAAPSWSDIFTDSTAINAPCGARNVNNLDRFVVLKTFHSVITSGGPTGEYFEGYVPMKHDVRYNTGTAGTVADIQSGALYLAYSSTNAIANVANSGKLIANIRLSFKDQ